GVGPELGDRLVVVQAGHLAGLRGVVIGCEFTGAVVAGGAVVEVIRVELYDLRQVGRSVKPLVVLAAGAASEITQADSAAWTLHARRALSHRRFLSSLA